MSRVRPLTIDEIAARGIDVAPFLKDFDELPNSIRTLAYRPDILAATLNLWTAVIGGGRLPQDLKYLVGHLASMAAGCRYCSAHTASNAHQAGASAARLEAIWDYEASPLFSDAERAAFRFAQAAGQVPNAVTDADFDDLRRWYSEEEILEFLSVIALYGFFNRWNDTLATPLESLPRNFAETHLSAHWDIGRHG